MTLNTNPPELITEETLGLVIVVGKKERKKNTDVKSKTAIFMEYFSNFVLLFRVRFLQIPIVQDV